MLFPGRLIFFAGAPMSSPKIIGSTATAVAQFGEVEIKIDDWINNPSKVHPTTLDLGESIFSSVGMLVTHWAYEEWLLADILRMLSLLKHKTARKMGLSSPRSKELQNKIRPLLAERGIHVDQNDWDLLSSLITKGDDARNLVSHCVWITEQTSGKLCAQVTHGEWPTKVGRKAWSRKEYPAALHIDNAWFSCALDDMKRAIEKTEALRALIEASLPS